MDYLVTNNIIFKGPLLEFTEQPADYRYRYLKERYHGHIVGLSSPATKKKDMCKFPKVKVSIVIKLYGLLIFSITYY